MGNCDDADGNRTKLPRDVSSTILPWSCRSRSVSWRCILFDDVSLYKKNKSSFQKLTSCIGGMCYKLHIRDFPNHFAPRYCRHEGQLRQALFFSAASIAGAFSGLLAFGIGKMDGVAGLEGWR